MGRVRARTVASVAAAAAAAASRPAVSAAAAAAAASRPVVSAAQAAAAAVAAATASAQDEFRLREEAAAISEASEAAGFIGHAACDLYKQVNADGPVRVTSQRAAEQAKTAARSVRTLMIRNGCDAPRGAVEVEAHRAANDVTTCADTLLKAVENKLQDKVVDRLQEKLEYSKTRLAKAKWHLKETLVHRKIAREKSDAAEQEVEGDENRDKWASTTRTAASESAGVEVDDDDDLPPDSDSDDDRGEISNDDIMQTQGPHN